MCNKLSNATSERELHCSTEYPRHTESEVSRIGKVVRDGYFEPKKRVKAETIVSGWLTVRSFPPP